MKILLQSSRFLVGVLFIFSGLVKANDPSGLSYKMQEFFEVWGWHALNDYTLALSILMITFEIIAGAALLIGWQFSLFSWLLLALTLFFTYLTGYAVLSGKIRACGCFGDCIPLTAQQSFIKDIILTILILLLVKKRREIFPLYSTKKSVRVLIIVTLATLAIQIYVLRNLPVVDCLPFKEGNNIPEKMKIPAGAIPDSTVITFVYNKEGKEIEFDADHFPADFNDSVYQFIKRYDKVVRIGNATPPIKDFVIKTMSGMDTTSAIMEQPGRTVIIFSRMLENESRYWTWLEDLRKLRAVCRTKNIPFLWISSDADNLSSQLKNMNWSDVTLLKGDDVAIKTAARTNPTIYLLNLGTIERKWSYTGLKEVIETID
jgi:uncharacterized membrane protein YphA (DoxX/SURF4 family)